MSPRSCEITGRGVVSSLGQAVAPFARAVLAGVGAIGPLVDGPDRLRFSNGALIRDFVPSDHFSTREIGMLDRFSQFATVAARQAWREAGLDRATVDPSRVGVVIGTANGGIDILDDGFRRIFASGGNPRPMTIPQTMASAPACRIAREIGATGPVFGVSSACASAAHAMIVGANLIRGGLIDVAVVGGADSCFCEGYLRAWDQLRVVSSDTCRPFSLGRKGLILGEGAGVLVLELPGRAAARDTRAVAHFLGGGMSCDAAELLAPDPLGMEAAIRRALADAGIAAEAVDHVNAHGTGTVANDRAEAAAIRAVFGARAASIPVSSTKSMVGHAMGASGAIEAIVAIAALESGIVPATLNFLEADPEIGLDVVPDVGRALAMNVVLSNSFAFGGLNASLVFGRTAV